MDSDVLLLKVIILPEATFLGSSELGNVIAGIQYNGNLSTSITTTIQECQLKVDGQMVSFQLWVFKGQERYRSINVATLQRVLGDKDAPYIVFYLADFSSPNSDIRTSYFELLNEYQNVYLLQAKSDLNPVINQEEIWETIMNNEFQDFIPVSALTGEGINILHSIMILHYKDYLKKINAPKLIQIVQ